MTSLSILPFEGNSKERHATWKEHGNECKMKGPECERKGNECEVKGMSTGKEPSACKVTCSRTTCGLLGGYPHDRFEHTTF